MVRSLICFGKQTTKMELRNKEGERVLLYDRHMPETDDLACIVLKGHLLVEEMLFHLAYLNLPHPHYLEDAKLGFFKLVGVVRAAIQDKSENAYWRLILELNSFRNKFAHNLDPPDLQNALDKLLKIDEEVQRSSGMTADESEESSLGDSERLKRVALHCMEFLLSLDHSEISLDG